MKNIYTFLFLFLITTSSFAQVSNIEVKKGEIITQTNDNFFFDLAPLGKVGDNTYYLFFPMTMYMSNVIGGAKDLQIGRLDKDLKLEQKKIELTYEGKELEYQKGILLKGQLIIFSSFQNKDQKKTYLFSQTVDKSSLSLKNDMKMIAEVDYSDENNYKNSNFTFAFSPDSSKVLISFSLLDNDNSLLTMGINIYDTNFKKLQTVLNPDFSSPGVYSFQKYFVTNTGEPFLLAEYYETRKDLEKSAAFKKQSILPGKRTLEVRPNYTHKLVQFNKSSKATAEYDLVIPGKFIANIDAKADGKGNIICAGFTAEKETTSVTGSCFFKIDPKSSKITSATNKDFTREFIMEGMDDKGKKEFLKNYGTDENFEHFFYQIHDIYQKKDGGYYLIGEKTKKELVSNQYGTSVVYDHRDVVVINFSKSGEVVWSKKINKIQEDLADYGYMYIGYAHAINNDNIYIAYTNLNKKSANMVGAWKNTEAILAKLDKEGNLTSTPIFNSTNDELTLRADDTSITPNEIIFYGKKNTRKHGFVKVNIN